MFYYFCHYVTFIIIIVLKITIIYEPLPCVGVDKDNCYVSIRHTGR